MVNTLPDALVKELCDIFNRFQDSIVGVQNLITESLVHFRFTRHKADIYKREYENYPSIGDSDSFKNSPLYQLAQALGIATENKDDALQYAECVIKRIELFPTRISEMALIYAVSIFEAYLNDTIKVAKSHFTNRKMPKKAGKGKDSIANHLSLKLKSICHVSLNDLSGSLDALNDIFETRNVLVHTKGKVDKDFLLCVKNSKYTVGDIVVVDEKYLDATFTLFRKIGSVITKELLKGYRPSLSSVNRRKTTS